MSIVLTDLTKRFGRNLVVNKVSLEVTDGHLFVLLGGSGSGKSTILRMIAGLIQPDGGTILLNGQDVTLLPPQARGIGFVFQNYSIFRHMTAVKNCWTWWDWLDWDGGFQTSFRADNSNELPWPALWPINRQCSCWTNRSELWMSRFVRNSAKL
jgi:ABC-type Fe3+/spermidine/putrescine transport system ATPase subunit